MSMSFIRIVLPLRLAEQCTIIREIVLIRVEIYRNIEKLKYKTSPAGIRVQSPCESITGEVRQRQKDRTREKGKRPLGVCQFRR